MCASLASSRGLVHHTTRTAGIIFNSIGTVGPIGRRRDRTQRARSIHRHSSLVRYGQICRGAPQLPSIFLILITSGTNEQHFHVTTMWGDTFTITTGPVPVEDERLNTTDEVLLSVETWFRIAVRVWASENGASRRAGHRVSLCVVRQYCT